MHLRSFTTIRYRIMRRRFSLGGHAIPDCSANEFINKLGRTLSDRPQPDEFLLQTALNEAWFSNTLAWLLDPRGSHGLGISFCQAFVSLIGRRRIESEGNCFQRATFLKRGKDGPGVGTTGCSFKNAAEAQ